MQWSEAQQKVIDARDANLLVSAAAGSGKTAVLVQRLIERISDPENPVSLNEMLVMTFTRAAASEMRERIGKALREKIALHPEDGNLRLQRAILPRAQISTIDSICQNLCKQYYQELDIDPGFSVEDEAKLTLLKADVLEALLEEQYESGSEDFRNLAETFQTRTDDRRIGALIEKIYIYAQSLPWPEEYLEEQLREAEREMSLDAAHLDEAVWMGLLCRETAEGAQEHAELLRIARQVCLEDGGPLPYLGSIEADIAALEKLAAAKGYAEQHRLVDTWYFPKIGTASAKKYDPEMIEFVKSVRNGYKSFIQKTLQGGLMILPEEEMAEVIRGSARLHRELLLLTKAFSERYAAAKREKNVVDFNDQEHFALELLYEKADRENLPADDVPQEMPAPVTKGRVFSPLADALAGRLREIMIDEYQDSNGVQEALLTALSGERFGNPDLFMVGDVKQSIYRFRKARPELFIEKSKTYGETGDHRKIELNQNFRSRPQVLDSVNEVFDVLMREELGGVEYDADARLYAGAVYETGEASVVQDSDAGASADPAEGKAAFDDEAADRNGNICRGIVQDPYRTEILLMDVPAEKDEELTGEMLEYSMIARRIRALLGMDGGIPMQVQDKETKKMRDLCCRDIAILMRAAKGHAETLSDILLQNGIPAYFERSAGYFTATEVQIILNYLRLIDNPRQDDALASVLRSPIVGCSDDTLALLRAEYREACRAAEKAQETAKDEGGSFFDALCYAADNTAAQGSGIEPREMKKLRNFYRQLQFYRDIANVVPVHMLLQRIFRETGYYDAVAAMPLGRIRRKNLDMLLEKAESFGGGIYHGLFNFIRSIDRMKKYNTDYGEAGTLTENDDVVRLMTIHGSKGLEFPVVILARAWSAGKNGDEEEGVLMDERIGIGSDYVDLKNRISYPGPKKMLIRRCRYREDQGEQLRLLYVAMTRAREKLIITGAASKAEEKANHLIEAGRIWKEYQQKGSETLPGSTENQTQGVKLPREVIARCRTHMEWVLLAAGASSSFELHYSSDEMLVQADRTHLQANEERCRELMQLDLTKVYDPAAARAIEAALCAVYPYETETMLKPKVSVSELKAGWRERTEAAEGAEYTEEAEHPEGIPETAVHEDWYYDLDDGAAEEHLYDQIVNEGLGLAGPAGTRPGGARRGTAFHRALQLLPLGQNLDPAAMLEAVLQDVRMSDEEKELLDRRAVMDFLRSDLARRMEKAAAARRLFREQHFMIGLPARELDDSQDSDELQLLQGIIDAYYEEEDGSLVLIDYKTDRVQNEEDLAQRYGLQLRLYERALTQLTGRPVRGKIIYSSWLKCAVQLNR